MIYHLHRTTGPFDPHRTSHSSLEQFLACNPPLAGANNPFDVYRHICREWPDAVFMPATVRIGSGSPVFLGVLANITAHGAAKPDEIPFVAWVRLEAETPMDQKVIRKGNPFERTFWKTPVRHAPNEGAILVKSELRASDLETPSPGEATIWEDAARGEFVVHMEVGGGEVSISVPVKSVRLACSCEHPSHFECTKCGACVCCSCNAHLAGPTEVFKTLGYTCRRCAHG